MVFVKVRETYDLHTTQNKMTMIGIHTPKADIIKRNYAGLLMQCKAYRPVSCDVKVACASVLPLDPLGVGTAPGSVSPEDVFNPILYKAISNKGMSQLEARISALSLGSSETGVNVDVDGNSAMVDVDDVTNYADEFNIYYSLLADTHSWKHANPQSGLSMRGLRPYVYDIVYNIGDSNGEQVPFTRGAGFPKKDGSHSTGNDLIAMAILGKPKEMPFINCTSYGGTGQNAGFDMSGVGNYEQDVPYIRTMVGVVIVPPSKLRELFYRMVVEWTLEFSAVRSLIEIQNWGGLNALASSVHYQNYSYSSTKEAVTGDSGSLLDSNDSCMVCSTSAVTKVM